MERNEKFNPAEPTFEDRVEATKQEIIQAIQDANDHPEKHLVFPNPEELQVPEERIELLEAVHKDIEDMDIEEESLPYIKEIIYEDLCKEISAEIIGKIKEAKESGNPKEAQRLEKVIRFIIAFRASRELAILFGINDSQMEDHIS